MVSVLGVAAPIGALAIAFVADTAFHPHPACREPAGYDRIIPGQPATPLATPQMDIFEAITIACNDGFDDCAPEAFGRKFGPGLSRLAMSRDELESRWLADLALGDHVAAYGLAWLGSRRALPELRRHLLGERSFYGWETSSIDAPENLYADYQYPRSRAMIVAIEQISGRPLRAVVKLSRAERAQLRRDAAGCLYWRPAIWLLNRLEGVALPDRRWNFRKRLSCED
jgi:hypothetical protein